MSELPRARPVSPDLIHGRTPGVDAARAPLSQYAPPSAGELHSAPPPLPASRKGSHWAATTAFAIALPTVLAIGTWIAFAMVCVGFYFVFGAPPSVYGPIWAWFTRVGTIWAAFPLTAALGFAIVAVAMLKPDRTRPIGRLTTAWVLVISGILIEAIGAAITIF